MTIIIESECNNISVVKIWIQLEAFSLTCSWYVLILTIPAIFGANDLKSFSICSILLEMI